MNRITISVDDELKQYLDEKSTEYDNRSQVIREALKKMKKAEMIADMRAYFREESSTEAAKDLEDEQIDTWSDLPDY